MTPETTDPRIAEIAAGAVSGEKAQGQIEFEIGELVTFLQQRNSELETNREFSVQTIDALQQRVQQCAAVFEMDRKHELIGPLVECACPSCSLHRRYHQRVEALTQELELSCRQLEDQVTHAVSAEQRLEAAERELTECRRGRVEDAEIIGRHLSAKEAAEATIARLREALRSYGVHSRSCAKRTTTALTWPKCDCGLDAALASLPSPPVSAPEDKP